jgi:hypothetical protein
MEVIKISEAEKAAFEAGLKTAQSLNSHSHKFTLEYQVMAIVQDALRAYRLAVTTKTP